MINKYQNMLLGCTAAVKIDSEAEFDELINWLSLKNTFTLNGNPVKKLTYPGKGAFILRSPEDMRISWALLKDINQDEYQIVDFKNLDLIEESEVIDADVVSETETIELDEKALTLVTNTKPEGTAIDSNVDKLVSLIPLIEAKANVVVTEENYKSFVAKGSGTVPELRRWAKAINAEKIRVVKAYEKPLNIYVDKVKLVVDALNSTAIKIESDAKGFDQKKKEQLRAERNADIDKLKNVLITKEMISEKFANKFSFDERWLNVTCSKKKFQEEVEKQFNDLMQLEKIEKQNDEMIVSTIKNTCLVAGIDESMLDPNKYRLLLSSGASGLGEITKDITDDVNRIKENIKGKEEAHKRELELQKQRFEKQQEQAKKELEEAKKQASEASKNISDISKKMENIADEKTGEVFAALSGEVIELKIQEAPAKVPEDKIFSYTYTFSGNCKAILTFNRFLKAMTKIFKTFKYKEEK